MPAICCALDRASCVVLNSIRFALAFLLEAGHGVLHRRENHGLITHRRRNGDLSFNPVRMRCRISSRLPLFATIQLLFPDGPEGSAGHRNRRAAPVPFTQWIQQRFLTIPSAYRRRRLFLMNQPPILYRVGFTMAVLNILNWNRWLAAMTSFRKIPPVLQQMMVKINLYRADAGTSSAQSSRIGEMLKFFPSSRGTSTLPMGPG